MYRFLLIGFVALSATGSAVAKDDSPTPGAVSCRCICSGSSGASVKDILGTGNWGDRSIDQCKSYSDNRVECMIDDPDDSSPSNRGELSNCKLVVHSTKPGRVDRPPVAIPQMQRAPSNNN